MKICTKCKLNKTESEFKSRGGAKAGLVARCRVCDRQYDREYYLKHKEREDRKGKEHQKKNREDNQRKKLEYLKTHPCVDCGTPDVRVLDFDHLADKKQTVARMVGGSRNTWKKIMAEITKCEVRCANCHRIKHYK